MTDPRLLLEFMSADTIQRPDIAELLVLDVTEFSPDEAGKAILRHVSALSASGELHAASAAARQLR